MADAYFTCAFCGHRFTEEERVVTCSRCSMFGAAGGCRKIRCPQCAYEMPPPARLPGLVAGLVKRVRKKKDETIDDTEGRQS